MFSVPGFGALCQVKTRECKRQGYHCGSMMRVSSVIAQRWAVDRQGGVGVHVPLRFPGRARG